MKKEIDYEKKQRQRHNLNLSKINTRIYLMKNLQLRYDKGMLNTKANEAHFAINTLR